MSVRELAEVCSAAGAPELSESSLNNLARSTGRRRATLQEWFVLAHVLQVPPVALILPLTTAGAVELVPGIESPIRRALAWVTATDPRALDGTTHRDIGSWIAIDHLRSTAMELREQANEALVQEERERDPLAFLPMEPLPEQGGTDG